MSPESDAVRLARIEESLVAHRGESRANHKAVMELLGPVVKESCANKEDLIRIKQNNKWVYRLVIVFPPSFLAMMGLFEWWVHFARAAGK
jgi:uncharacterized membrane protein YjdF